MPLHLAAYTKGHRDVVEYVQEDAGKTAGQTMLGQVKEVKWRK
jgi:hypothetical protein